MRLIKLGEEWAKREEKKAGTEELVRQLEVEKSKRKELEEERQALAIFVNKL